MYYKECELENKENEGVDDYKPILPLNLVTTGCGIGSCNFFICEKYTLFSLPT